MAGQAFELEATLDLNTSEYDKKLNDSGSKLKNLGAKMATGFKTAAKIGAAAVAAGATAVGALVKSSVDAYADNEQLVGGVETLFGAGGQSLEEYAASVGKTVDSVRGEYNFLMKAQKEVMDNAANAYRTAGMSANEYMETVTSFSASLISSVGGDTAEAAKIADMAITDMSDNANKMGTDMESIQNAYQGFAKQNYTMLDNLKLGYGGTEKEMKRLLEDAEKISGIHYDIENLNEVYEAIHVIQTEMGITGTTAKEAEKTISGSIGMMKASWQNLVTGISDPKADLGQLIDNFVDSASKVGENLLPVVEKALNGVADLIDKLLPKILEKIPQLMNDLLPKLLNAATKIITTVVGNLPELIQSQLPVILQAIIQVIDAIIPQLPAILDVLIKSILEVIGLISDQLPTIIPKLVDLLLGIVDVLLDNIDLLIDGAIKLALGIAEGMTEAIPKLVQAIPKLVVALVKALVTETPKILEGGLRLFAALGEALISAIGEIIMMIPELIDQILSLFTELAPDLAGFFSDAWTLIQEAWQDAVEWFSGVWEGITEAFSAVGEWFSEKFNEAWEGITEIWDKVTQYFSDVWEGVKQVFNNVKQWFSDLFQGAYDAVTGIWDAITGFFQDVWDSIVGIFVDAGVAVGDAISGAVKGAVNAILSAATGIINGFITAINIAISVINAIPGVKISKLYKLDAPQLEEGIGLAEKGKQYLLEGKGREAVVPIDKDQKWTKKVANDMLTALGETGAGGRDIIIPVYIGNDQIQEIIIKANQINDFRNGGVT